MERCAPINECVVQVEQHGRKLSGNAPNSETCSVFHVGLRSTTERAPAWPQLLGPWVSPRYRKGCVLRTHQRVPRHDWVVARLRRDPARMSLAGDIIVRASYRVRPYDSRVSSFPWSTCTWYFPSSWFRADNQSGTVHAMSVEVEQIHLVTDELVEAARRLLPQLSSSTAPLSSDDLTRI